MMMVKHERNSSVIYCAIPWLTLGSLIFRTHPTIIRVKVEDRDEPTTRASEIPGNINQSYRSRNSSSPSGASMRRMSTSTTSTSLTPYDAPSPLRVPSESGGETAPTSSIPTPLNLSTLSSTIQKKRRVTVSGASVPSSTRSIYGQMSTVVSPVSPAVIGFSVPETPEAVDQLRSALSFKQSHLKGLRTSRVLPPPSLPFQPIWKQTPELLLLLLLVIWNMNGGR